MLCSKELWCIISGRSSLLKPAEIKTVLNQNHERFFSCLNFFKKASEKSSSLIKNDKTIKWRDIILNISSLLDLDAVQTYELFQNYLRTEYQGTQKQLQEKAECDSNANIFFLEIAKFYFEERLFLLKCVKYILSYWQDPYCLFRTAFAEHVDIMVNEGFIDQLIAQLKNLFLNGKVHSGIQGRKIFEKMHSAQGLKEQHEILEILLLYYNNFELSGQKLIEFATFFQSIKFGFKQPDKRYLHASDDEVIRSIGFLCCLVLLEGIDLGTLHSLRENRSWNDDHHIFTNKEIVQKLDEIFLEWDNFEEQSPVVLAWSIVRYYRRDDGNQIFEELGRKATAFDICGYLISMLKYMETQDSTVLSNVIMHIIYTLVDHTFLIFHEESFGSVQKVYLLLQLIVSSSDVHNTASKAGIKNGVSILLESTKKRFPFILNSYLDILASMAQDFDSANEVYETFDNLNSMTEHFDKNKLNEMNTTDNPRIWTRLCDKLIIKSGNDHLIVPAGALGTVSESGGLNLIRWNCNYSGWDFVILYIRKQLEEPMIDNITGVISDIGSIVKLVKAVISNDWGKAEGLEPLISSAFNIIKRFHNCPDALNLISDCLELLVVVAKQVPKQVVAQLNEICFLPVYRNITSAVNDMNSIGNMLPCVYGFIVDQIETQKGIYPVTLAYLQFMNVICSQISSINKEEFHCYLANIKCIFEHIFGSFLQWKFTNPSEKKRLAKVVLEICYSLLGQFNETEATDENKKFASLASDLVLDSFMNGKSGETLLEILSVGVETINYSLHDFSRNEVEQEKEMLIQTVKLAFAVLNKILSLKQIPDVSALENGLCKKIVFRGNKVSEFQVPENVPLINVIARYIYHNNDPKLATLGVIALRKICVINSVSVLASFGSDAHPLRNAYVTRLNSEVESIKLRISIIELLKTAVETQPGLVELFLHQHLPIIGKEQSQKKDFGEFSCLPAIFKFMSDKKNLYPLTLKLAAVRFLHALWMNRSDSTLSVIRTRSKFWTNITLPIVESDRSKLKWEELELWTLVIKILTLEIFYVANEDFDSDFLSAMDDIERSGCHNKIIKIFEFENYSDKDDLMETKTADLIESWRHFVIVGSTFHPSKVHLDSSERKEMLLLNLASSFQSQVDHFNGRISRELTCSFMILATRWASSLSNSEKLFEETIKIMQLYLKNSECLHHEVSNNLFSSFLVIGHKYSECMGHKKIDDKILLRLASSVCKCMQELETDKSDNQSISNILILMINSLSLIARCLSTKSSFYDILNDHGTMPFMLSALKYSLQVSTRMGLANGIIGFYITLNKDQKLAELLSSRSILQAFVASWNYQPERCFTDETWVILLAFVAGILKTSRHAIIDDVIDFICAFKERILQAKDLARRISSLHLLEESNAISKLLFQLSFYWDRCLFLQSESMNEIKGAATSMLQTSVVLLSKPMLLNYIVGARGVDSVETNIQKDSMSEETFQSILQGDNDNDKAGESSRRVQETLIEILANTTGMIRTICPDILDTITDQENIQQVYYPLIDIGFGMPSLDSMMPISLGTFIASINTCLKILFEISHQESPKSSPTRKSSTLVNGNDLLRKMLNFIMDSSLVIMISEASYFLRNAEGEMRTKQIVKRELGSEIQNFLSHLNRFSTRRNVPHTPRSSDHRSPLQSRRSPSKLGFSHAQEKENCLYIIADEFSRQMLQ